MEDTETPCPTTEEILKACPRFRILVVGKSGVGKSSLINYAFGINLATSSDHVRGQSKIEDEIISEHNDRFVLHDSMGFEHGQTKNLEKAKEFLQAHGESVPLKDRVHVIWLCIQIPHAGGRVFETGDEEFLKITDIPVIVVFTQFDTLCSRMEEELTPEEQKLPAKHLERLCSARADVEFHSNCVGPLAKINSAIQFARTSGLEKDYPSPDRPALEDLIDITQNLVKGTAWYVSAMAQRTSAMQKINVSIEVGMQRYWLSLASNTDLLGLKLEMCIKLLHFDITASWNFDDDKLLNSEEFRTQIKSFAQLVTPDVSDVNSWFPNEHLYTLVGLFGSAVASVMAPALGAIGLSAMFVRWLAKLYVNTPEVLRFLIGYIVDLTLVLDQLFSLVVDIRPPHRITVDDINLALENYKNSNTAAVHNEIRRYANKATVAEICHSSKAEDKVKELIKKHCAK